MQCVRRLARWSQPLLRVSLLLYGIAHFPICLQLAKFAHELRERIFHFSFFFIAIQLIYLSICIFAEPFF